MPSYGRTMVHRCRTSERLVEVLVTGEACSAKCYFNHAFLWKNDGSGMILLGTLGGHGSYSEAINSAGQVTGSSSTAAGTYHAFLWRNDGSKLQDINALVDPLDP